MNEKDTGVVALILWAILILVTIWSGVWAWNFVSPEGFIGGLGFIIAWAIFARIAHFIVFSIGVALLHTQPTQRRNDRIIDTQTTQSPEPVRLSEVIEHTPPQTRRLWHTHRTLSECNDRFGEVIFSQTKLDVVERIYGKPDSATEKSSFYHAHYPNGLTFIIYKGTSGTVVGVRLTTECKAVISVDNDIVGEDDSISPSNPKTFTFSQATPLRAFYAYSTIMNSLCLSPHEVLKEYPSEYVGFIYSTEEEHVGKHTLKLFARKDNLDRSNLNSTPIEIIELIYVDHSLFLS